MSHFPAQPLLVLSQHCSCKDILCTSHGGSQFAADLLSDDSGWVVLECQLHSVHTTALSGHEIF